MTHKIKIILADRSPIILKGLKNLLNDFSLIDIIKEADNWEFAVRSVNKNTPDYLIFNSNLLNNSNSKKLSSHFNNKVKLISIYNVPIPENIKAQCFYSININSNEEELIKNFKHALEIPKIIIKKESSELSNREKAVVRCIALGMTNKEIADTLFISTHTVIAHRKNITKKLAIKTVSGLTVYALLNELVNTTEIEQY
ncbi:MAG: response regulator transcription factor [Chlorobi bacterium]|nr:response regulator transcription factor [Chlorobiota bacterium]